MKSAQFTYPAAHQEDVVDTFHGIEVTDPYRWLETPDAPATQAFIAAQNELTESFLSEIPARAMIQRRLTELWDYTKYGTPKRKGDFYYFWRNDGLQNQAVLYRAANLDDEPEQILDPNTLTDDGTAAVTGEEYSKDGRYIAYRVSVHGSDQQQIYIRDTVTGADLDEVLTHCRFASIAWLEDGSGFFYDRYPDPTTVAPEDTYNFNAVYFHQLNTPQSADQKIFDDPDAKEWSYRVQLTHDERYMVLSVWYAAAAKNKLYYRAMGSNGPFMHLIDAADQLYSLVGSEGDTFFVHTDYLAPRGRIVAVDLATPARDAWRDLIPEGDGVIAMPRIINGQFVIATMENAHHKLNRYELDGTPAGSIPLPGIGTLLAINGERGGDEMFLSYQSYIQPPSILRYDFTTDTTTTIRSPQLPIDTADFVTEQHWYTSKDGTQVSIFVNYKKGLKKDGQNPTLLYGYGGFSVSLTPMFTPTTLYWLEQGGVFAVANLRGGNEYGDEWHRGGMLLNKQNVFDDFIGAGEWLIDEGYTSTPKLAIHGRSNGGLLTSACLLQRPDLFGAALVGVPVIDMLRYHRFTAGKYWVAEYGDVDNEDEFNAMMAYSPLHNIKEGETYPPTLVYTAEADDRVVPMHTLKFAATIQEKDSGQNPLLVRFDTKSGHGLGKPTAKVIEEYADIYAFLWRMLAMNPA